MKPKDFLFAWWGMSNQYYFSLWMPTVVSGVGWMGSGYLCGEVSPPVWGRGRRGMSPLMHYHGTHGHYFTMHNSCFRPSQCRFTVCTYELWIKISWAFGSRESNNTGHFDPRIFFSCYKKIQVLACMWYKYALDGNRKWYTGRMMRFRQYWYVTRSWLSLLS